MKRILFILVFLSSMTICYSQNVTFGTTYSFGEDNLLGFDLLGVTKSGFSIGVSGSRLLESYNGEGYGFPKHVNAHGLKEKHREIKANPDNTFSQRHWGIKVLSGYSFNKTSIQAELGLGFNMNYYLKTNYAVTPESKDAFTYNQSKGRIFYGVNVYQEVKGRLGVIAGYNTFERFRAGLSWRITPTKMFKW